MTWTRVILLAYVALFNYPSGILAAPRTRHNAPSLRHKSGGTEAELEELLGYLDRGGDAEAAKTFQINKDGTPSISYCDDTPTTEKIIGGEPAPVAWRNWAVQIYDSSGDIHCGGSRISPRLILTAAHCFFTPRDHDNPGGEECQDKRQPAAQQPAAKLKLGGGKSEQINIDLVYRHHAFSKLQGSDRTNEFDVAIAVLSKEFDTPFSPGFCLSKTKNRMVNDTCYAVGFSYTDKLSDKPDREPPKHLHRRRIERLNCRKLVDNLHPDFKKFSCATESGTKGDSGGPVVCWSNGESEGTLPYLLGTIAQVKHNEEYMIVHNTARPKEQWIARFLNSTGVLNYNGCHDMPLP